MRLIDADPIMKFIRDGLNEKDPQEHIGYDGIRIMTEIEYAPTVQSAPVWTPCSDGMPKAQTRDELLRKPNEYIVDMVYEGSNEHIVTTLGYGDIHDLYGYVEGYEAVWVRLDEYTTVGEGYTVIAWKPLPAPYNPD